MSNAEPTRRFSFVICHLAAMFRVIGMTTGSMQNMRNGREPGKTLTTTPNLDILRKTADDVRRQRSTWEISAKAPISAAVSKNGKPARAEAVRPGPCFSASAAQRQCAEHRQRKHSGFGRNYECQIQRFAGDGMMQIPPRRADTWHDVRACLPCCHVGEDSVVHEMRRA